MSPATPARNDADTGSLEGECGTEPEILRPGHNCQARVRAERLAWLIDGENFFDALGRALAVAERQVLLVGWDFHSRVELWRGEAGIDAPRELVALLEDRVRRNRKLRVHVLGWDYAALYSLEREFFPRLRFGRATHRRIDFQLDSAHPLLASQHQKVVVVDDSIAFVGGFDVTAHRWDRRAHAPSDPLRKTPDGTRYGPFHDVQVAVSGPAAASLGALARERWRRATGRRLSAPRATGPAWPETLTPHGRDADVGIARTEPAFEDREGVREIERLHLDSIAAARKSIYIENQYLTSESVASALAERLVEPDGPDVVIVGPRRASGWLEEGSMGVLRSRLVANLTDADRFGRLRILYPHVPGLGDEIVNVHAKVMVIDDRFARVGSSNLSNRSMGFDTECDLALDAGPDPAWRPVVRALRDELLAEHLDLDVEHVATAIEKHGSLAEAVDAMRRAEGRTLRPIEDEPGEWTAELLAAGVTWADPEAPLSIENLRERVAGDAPKAFRRERGRAMVWVALAALCGGLLALWL